MPFCRVLDKLAATDDRPACLRIQHEDGAFHLVVPFELFQSAEVGADIAVPDDLDSAHASASGYFKMAM